MSRPSLTPFGSPRPYRERVRVVFMATCAWGCEPLTFVLSPVSQGRGGKAQPSTTRISCVSQSTVALTNACRSVMLVTNRPRLPSDQNFCWKDGSSNCSYFFLLTSPATLPKKLFAALLECAAATVLHALEQCLHCLKPLHSVPEFRDLSL